LDDYNKLIADRNDADNIIFIDFDEKTAISNYNKAKSFIGECRKFL
jgi:hypothetical protein